MPMETDRTNVAEYCSMAAIRYAKVLFELAISDDIIQNTAKVFEEVPELEQVLANPVIANENKFNLIDRVFPGQMCNFLKVVTDYGKIVHIREIFHAYSQRRNEMVGIVTAILSYAAAPQQEQLKQMETFICREFSARGVVWEFRERPELIEGFLLYVNGKEYDYSARGRLARLEQKLTWR